MNRKTLEYLRQGQDAKREARAADDKLVQERIARGGRDAPKKGIEGTLRNTLAERDQETKLVSHHDDDEAVSIHNKGDKWETCAPHTRAPVDSVFIMPWALWGRSMKPKGLTDAEWLDVLRQSEELREAAREKQKAQAALYERMVQAGFLTLSEARLRQNGPK